MEKRKVKTSEGTIEYDYLVVALGSETNFFGLDHSKAFTLKSLDDAYKIRNHVIDMFEKASLEKDKKKRKDLLTFAVVGGGPTGV
ncbi:FAD-dependent oxidoreductase, partial [Nanoarchaeota archaeon]